MAVLCVADEEVLRGGVANAGSVRRVGDIVVRPANDHSHSIHALLRHVRSTGFDGVPEPLALDPSDHELLPAFFKNRPPPFGATPF